MASHTLAAFPPELLASKKQIREQARSYGLDFFNVIYEMCDYEQMNQIAAYGGFPQRYPHWRFGMEYERLRKQHFYGLGRIYEMVINNDPCYAYLQESNALIDQKLVIAHVYGHSDFFKNNYWFSRTNRKMMDEMANHSTRFRKHIEKHGYDTVEKFADVCLSLEHLIDPYSMFMNRGPVDTAHAVHMPPGGVNPYKIGVELFRDIEDRWNKGKFGKEYEEANDLGAKKKWDKGLGLGREKIFEVRRVYNDVNFIDEFMTPEFIEKHKFYQYGRDPHTGQLRIVSRDPTRIKQTMLYQLTNMGQPFIYVVDGNYCNRGELYLAHKHNGLDIEIKFAVETLKNVYKIWQRPVHLQARIDDDMILFSYAGDQPKQQTIHDDLPKPAHQMG